MANAVAQAADAGGAIPLAVRSEMACDESTDLLLDGRWRAYATALELYERSPTPDRWRTLRDAWRAWHVAYTTECGDAA
ncbi:MAG: hypothetical protein OXG42_10055 [Chloroflexi bacterium]|nr:hypothetical protein [Chloroflexota bacterium]